MFTRQILAKFLAPDILSPRFLRAKRLPQFQIITELTREMKENLPNFSYGMKQISLNI